MRTHTYPDLNTDLILDLIHWAEKSESQQDDPRFSGWGRWYQGAWARITNKTDKRKAWGTVQGVGPEVVKDPNICGTAFCMAGQTVVQNGYALIPEARWLHPDSPLDAYYCIQQKWTGEYDDKGKRIYEDVGRKRYISEAARDILGFTVEEANAFFNGTNTIGNLKEMANDYAEVRLLPPLFFEDGTEYHS